MPLLALLLTGCAAVPIAVVGTAVGIAGTAVSTGADVYSMGKLDTAEPVSLEEIRTAVFLAADALHLTARFEKPHDHQREIRFVDDCGGVIDVYIVERTPTLTRIRIDVGAFGDQPTARLFLQLTRAHFPPPE